MSNNNGNGSNNSGSQNKHDDLDDVDIFSIAGNADIANTDENDSKTIRLRLSEGVTLCQRFLLGKEYSNNSRISTRWASDLENGGSLIVGIPAPSIQADTATIESMRRGYIKITNLRHPHIAPLLGTFHDEDQGFFTVRQHVNGKSLDVYWQDYVKQNKQFPFSETKRIIEDLAAALDYANAQGVVHRNLRPQNIIISPDKGVQIINYVLPFETDPNPNDPYRSPEDRSNNPVDGKSDQYSLATIAYELISRQQAIIVGVHDSFVPQPIPGVSNLVDTVFHRALSKDSDDRYENCKAFVNALEKAFAEPARAVKQAPKTTTAAATTKTQRQPKVALVVAISAVILSVAAAALYFLFVPQKETPKPQEVAKSLVAQPAPTPAKPVEETEAEPVGAEEPKEDEKAEPVGAEKPKEDEKAESVGAEEPKENEKAEPVSAEKPKEEKESKISLTPPMAEPVEEPKPVILDDTELTKQDLAQHKIYDQLIVKIEGNSELFRWCPPCPNGFMMGSPANEPKRNEDERQHKIILTRGFWILETEVTQQLYRNVSKKTPSDFQAGTSSTLPVENVSWEDCQDFIRLLNSKQLPDVPSGYKFALPTEAQWEYACRAETQTPFAFGKTLSSQIANCGGDTFYDADAPDGLGMPTQGPSRWKTVAVKSYPPNAWGIHDMHGNVFEWCSDYYADYPAETVTNPQGPAFGEYRVRRGGSWGRSAEYCRSACRRTDVQSTASNRIGFRLVIVPVGRNGF